MMKRQYRSKLQLDFPLLHRPKLIVSVIFLFTRTRVLFIVHVCTCTPLITFLPAQLQTTSRLKALRNLLQLARLSGLAGHRHGLIVSPKTELLPTTVDRAKRAADFFGPGNKELSFILERRAGTCHSEPGCGGLSSKTLALPMSLSPTLTHMPQLSPSLMDGLFISALTMMV